MDHRPFGRYRLMGLLGRGGMGEVWRAYDTGTDRVVAVKLLPPHLAEDREFQQRFREEAHTAAALNEPHIVPIHDFGEIDGRLYVEMRLIEGRELGAVLATEGCLDMARAVAIVRQIATALDAAHRAGLVHRDVKPSNILLTDTDFAYLIDFGIARSVDRPGLTQTGSAIGTWAYMAPERFNGAQLDWRSDIYALGCVLYECLTGQQPFPGGTMGEQLTGHLTAPPPRPSAVRRSIPPAMDAVIARSMAKDPVARYGTAPELAAAAGEGMQGFAPAKSFGLVGRVGGANGYPAVAWWRRNVAKVAAATTAVVAIGGATIWMMGSQGSQQTRSTATATATWTSTSTSAEPDDPERQARITRQKVRGACGRFASSSSDAVDAANNYVEAFNNGGDIPAAAWLAVVALNHSAEEVAGAVNENLSAELKDAFGVYVEASRSLADAIRTKVPVSVYNARKDALNRARQRGMELC